MKIEGNEVPGVIYGNAWQPDDNPGGWLVGWSRYAEASDLLFIPEGVKATDICLKWFCHKAGDPNGKDKPISNGRSVSILASSDGSFVFAAPLRTMFLQSPLSMKGIL